MALRRAFVVGCSTREMRQVAGRLEKLGLSVYSHHEGNADSGLCIPKSVEFFVHIVDADTYVESHRDTLKKAIAAGHPAKYIGVHRGVEMFQEFARQGMRTIEEPVKPPEPAKLGKPLINSTIDITPAVDAALQQVQENGVLRGLVEGAQRSNRNEVLDLLAAAGVESFWLNTLEATEEARAALMMLADSVSPDLQATVKSTQVKQAADGTWELRMLNHAMGTKTLLTVGTADLNKPEYRAKLPEVSKPTPKPEPKPTTSMADQKILAGWRRCPTGGHPWNTETLAVADHPMPALDTMPVEACREHPKMEEEEEDMIEENESEPSNEPDNGKRYPLTDAERTEYGYLADQAEAVLTRRTPEQRVVLRSFGAMVAKRMEGESRVEWARRIKVGENTLKRMTQGVPVSGEVLARLVKARVITEAEAEQVRPHFCAVRILGRHGRKFDTTIPAITDRVDIVLFLLDNGFTSSEVEAATGVRSLSDIIMGRPYNEACLRRDLAAVREAMKTLKRDPYVAEKSRKFARHSVGKHLRVMFSGKNPPTYRADEAQKWLKKLANEKVPETLKTDESKLDDIMTLIRGAPAPRPPPAAMLTPAVPGQPRTLAEVAKAAEPKGPSLAELAAKANKEASDAADKIYLGVLVPVAQRGEHEWTGKLTTRALDKLKAIAAALAKRDATIKTEVLADGTLRFTW